MTGTVTWEVLAWLIGIIVAAGTAVAIFLYWVWSLVKTLRADWEADLADRDLKIEAAMAHAKLIEDSLTRELADYRQHAGETFATKEGVTGAVARVEAAVGRLTSQIESVVDRLSSRIDRLLEDRSRGG
jgi:ubiquinone biosynthesis protein UbiJ